MSNEASDEPMDSRKETAQRIVSDLHKLGVAPGDIVLVHVSYKSLGEVAGGAGTVIESLLNAVSPDGTLLMPALSYATVSAKNPVFDQAATPSCVGYLTECFRTWPGVLRSLHPTHSLSAIGARAGELLEGHRRDTTPCGACSPFAKLPAFAGKLLMIGCGLKPNTSMHAVEERVAPPYLYDAPVTYQMRPIDGAPFTMTVRRHGFKGYVQRYDRLETLLDESAGEIRRGKVLAADCHLVDIPAMWRRAEAALRRDRFFFVDARAPE